MSETAQQLVLDLPWRPALGAADFVVAGSNQLAVEMIDRWPHWEAPVLLLLGPEGSGKTHLTHVWQAASGAVRLMAADLGAIDPASIAGRPFVVEDGDRGISDERGFFHLLNLARQTGSHVLVTGRTSPVEWSIALPDLISRLKAAPVVRLGPIDETLLRAVLVKLFSDRQLPATPAAVNHLARHLEQSMAAALAAVERIDMLLWERRGSVTRALVADVLAELQGSDREISQGARSDTTEDDSDAMP